MPGRTRSNISYMQLRKIEILTAVAGKDFAYGEGVREVPADIAKSLISGGLAKPYKKVERAVKKKKTQKAV